MRNTDLVTQIANRLLIVLGRKVYLSFQTKRLSDSGFWFIRRLVCMILVILLVISLDSWLYARIQEDNWYSRAISLKVAVTKKQQLEQLFPEAKITNTNSFDWGSSVSYRSKNAWFRASYAHGGCKPENPKGYDLPDDTLISFSYFAFKGIRLSDLKDLQLSHLESVRESDTPNETYTDYETGRVYIVYQQRELTSVGLFATEALIKEMLCQPKN